MSGNQRPDNPSHYRTDWWWIFDPRLSLRARTVLVVGIGGILFTVLVVWIAGILFSRSLSDHLGPSLETLAFQLNDKLNRSVRETVRELQLVAKLPMTKGGAQSIELKRLLESLQAGSREYAWIGFVDATGKVTMGTRGQGEGEQADARAWFRTARRSGFAVTLEDWPALNKVLSHSASDFPSHLTIAAAVQGEADINGMIVAVLNWEWAKNLQYTVVPNAVRGVPLAATVYLNPTTAILDSGAGWEAPPDAPELKSREPRGWMVENSANGSTYLTGYARSRAIEGYGGTGWVVFARQPLNDLLAPIASLQRSIAYWAIGLLVPLLVAAWIIAGKFSDRLDLIARSADRIRDGDTLTEIPRPPGEGELSRMCESLDEMIADLRTRQPAAGENIPPVDPRFPV